MTGTRLSFAQARRRRLNLPAMRIQMVIVEIVIGTVHFTPPNTQATTGLAHSKICVQDYAVDTVIAAFDKVAVKGRPVLLDSVA